MIIIIELSAELKIQLVPELPYPLTDVFGLHFQIFVIIKSDLHDSPIYCDGNLQTTKL